MVTYEEVLELYKTIKGETFTGVYKGTRQINYEGGKSTNRILVKVTSPKMISAMEKITNIDPWPEDRVWKGIVKDTFWVKNIEGDMQPYAGSQRFKIIAVEPIHGLNWQRKHYEAVINITLQVVEE